MDKSSAYAYTSPSLPAYDCSPHTSPQPLSHSPPQQHSLDRKGSQDALGALPTYHDSQRLRSHHNSSLGGRKSFSFESSYGIPLGDTQREYIWGTSSSSSGHGASSSSASSPRSFRSEASSETSHRSDATSNTSCHSLASSTQLNKHLSLLPAAAEKRAPRSPSSTSIRFSNLEAPPRERAGSSQSHRRTLLDPLASPNTRSTYGATLRPTDLRPRRAVSARMSGLGLPRGPMVLELCESSDGSGSLTFRFPTHDQDVLLAARIPPMKAGYKAILTTPRFNDDAGAAEALYEVRREPLSKRYDFRLPTGEHTVLSKESAKAYTLEANDGQRLCWRQEASGNFSLVSLPSAYVLATYRFAVGPAQTRGGSFSVAADVLRGTLQVLPISQSSQDVPTQARRSPSAAATATASGSGANSMHRTISSSLSVTSTLSSAPRLGPAFRTLAVGLVLPGLASCAPVAPHASIESTRKSELLGDELINLGFGRLSLNTASPVAAARRAVAADEEDLAALGVELETDCKSSDPRPRAVPLPLIAASLIAVLASRGQA